MTDLTDLTDDDFAVLLDALEAWERKDFAAQIMGDVMAATLFKPDDTQGQARFQAARDEERLKYEREQRVRKERSVLLRAKLIAVRNTRRVDEVERAVNRS